MLDNQADFEEAFRTNLKTNRNESIDEQESNIAEALQQE